MNNTFNTSPVIGLFGCRSPIIVDYSETCLRLKQQVFGIAIVEGNRCNHTLEVVSIESYSASEFRHSILPCAFGPRRRKKLWQLAEELECRLSETLVDPTSILPSNLRVGLGGFINAGTVVGLSLIHI